MSNLPTQNFPFFYWHTQRLCAGQCTKRYTSGYHADTSDPRHTTLRHWLGMSGHTSAEVSKRQFGPKCRTLSPYGPKCLTPRTEVFCPIFVLSKLTVSLFQTIVHKERRSHNYYLSKNALHLLALLTFSWPVLFYRSHAQLEPRDGYSRFMAQMTWFSPSTVLFGVRTMSDIIWQQPPSKKSKNRHIAGIRTHNR